jgi:hypothetical protein
MQDMYSEVALPLSPVPGPEDGLVHVDAPYMVTVCGDGKAWCVPRDKAGARVQDLERSYFEVWRGGWGWGWGGGGGRGGVEVG